MNYNEHELVVALEFLLLSRFFGFGDIGEPAFAESKVGMSGCFLLFMVWNELAQK